MEPLTQLLTLGTEALWQGGAVFLRVGALAGLLPGFGERGVPVRVKFAIALAFTLVVTPAVTIPPIPADLLGIAGLILGEVAIGVMLGIGLRLFVMALQIAGSIAAQSTSLAQVLGNAVAEPVPAMGHILVTGGLALSMLMGLHVKIAAFVILSYEMLPLGALPGGPDVSHWGVDRVRHAFALAFTLAAPFVLLSVLYNLAIGVINKAMPQLMVAFVGAPLITAGGLFMLLMSAPLLLSVWLSALDGFLANPAGPVP